MFYYERAESLSHKRWKQEGTHSFTTGKCCTDTMFWPQYRYLIPGFEVSTNNIPIQLGEWEQEKEATCTWWILCLNVVSSGFTGAGWKSFRCGSLRTYAYSKLIVLICVKVWSSRLRSSVIQSSVNGIVPYLLVLTRFFAGTHCHCSGSTYLQWCWLHVSIQKQRKSVTNEVIESNIKFPRSLCRRRKLIWSW